MRVWVCVPACASVTACACACVRHMATKAPAVAGYMRRSVPVCVCVCVCVCPCTLLYLFAKPVMRVPRAVNRPALQCCALNCIINAVLCGMWLPVRCSSPSTPRINQRTVHSPRTVALPPAPQLCPLAARLPLRHSCC
jgi:hypothetical protein